MDALDASEPIPREYDVHCKELPYSPTLTPYVQQVLHTSSRVSRGHRFTIPPSDGMFLGLNCGDPLTCHFSNRVVPIEPRLFICGQLQNEVPVLSCKNRFSLISIQLTPTGFFRLFNTSASPYTDQLTDLEKIAVKAGTLEANWLRQSTAEDLLSAIECSLLALSGKHAPVEDVEQAVAAITHCDGLIRVDEVARLCNVNTRQLRRRFRRVVGVAPKYFAKSLQIKSIMAQLTIRQDMPLRLLAHDHGYFDQSHFIHDFQRLIGVNPTAFQQDEAAFLSTYRSRHRKPNLAGGALCQDPPREHHTEITTL